MIVLKKLKNDELTTGWKVVTLLFVNTVAGILLLCMPAPKVEEAPTTEQTTAE
ncbi:MAG: hypothetical protein IKC97_05425 [Clostridia bacterium]|nr:hypothetical protein [Clostridia bacterium]